MKLLLMVALKKGKAVVNKVKEEKTGHTLKNIIVDQEVVDLQEVNGLLGMKIGPMTSQRVKMLLKVKLIKKDSVHAVKDVI